MSARKITCLLFLLASTVVAQPASAPYDFFPLAKGLTWRYEYYAEGEFGQLQFLEQAYLDSGIVQFKIIDSLVYNDSTSAWLIEEYDSLKVRRYNFSAQPRDTVYWRVATVIDTLFEKTFGRHELTGFYNDHVRIWDFNSSWWTPAYFRYADSNKNQILLVNHGSGSNRVDTLRFKGNLGLVEINGYGSRYNITWQWSSVKTTLIGSMITSVSDVPSVVPAVYEAQNYPNPFNPTTVISYQLPVTSHVNLKIYNVLGQEVATLVEENREAGNHNVRWNALGLSSGVYFYQLHAVGEQGNEAVLRKKMVLLR